MDRLLSGYSLEADAGERLSLGEVTILIRASSESTGGAFTLLEEVPPLVDTRLHVHAREDELFYVLDGEHVFRCGEEEHRIGPGGIMFAPRGVPHSQRRVEPGVGRLLVLACPGGLDEFFRDLAAADARGALNDSFEPISERHGITWLE